MIMFSRLCTFTVRDQHDQKARLRDLAVDLSAHDYPPATHVVFRRMGEHRAYLPWSEIERVDFKHHVVHVKDLSQATSIDDDPLERDALLDRDIMDALVLDLPTRQSVRANDLWLGQHDDVLELHAADVGAWAVIRRLARGLFGTSTNRRLLDWRDVEFLRGDPQAARAGHDYHRRVADLQPSEIARMLEALPYLHAAELLELLEEHLAADTLEVMRSERQVQIFEEFEERRRTRLLELMAPDTAADLLGRLGPDTAKANLEPMPTQARDKILELLRYPEDTAGGIMTNDIVVVEADLNVGQARSAIREPLQHPDFVYYVYAVDSLKDRHLEGVLTLRDLLVANEDAPLRNIMKRTVEALDPSLSATDAARRVAEQHFAALPVVNRDGQLLGAVTADAALVQISPPSLIGQQPRVFT